MRGAAARMTSGPPVPRLRSLRSRELPRPRREGTDVETPIRLEDVRLAWEARDPETVPLIVELAGQADPAPETPIREGAPTFERFLAEIHGKDFHRKPRDEQASLRQTRFRALE